MGHNSSVAASLKPEPRKQLFIEMQSSSQKITAIAKKEGVSRKFLYQQQQKGNKALEKEFNQSKEESEILYWIPVTKQWIFQVILGLILICHSSNPRSSRILKRFIGLSFLALRQCTIE